MIESELDELVVLTYCKEQCQFQIDSVVEERKRSIEKCKNSCGSPNYLFLGVFAKNKSPYVYITEFAKIIDIEYDKIKMKWVLTKNAK